MKTTRFLPAVAATLITAGALAVPSLAQDAGQGTPPESSQGESTEPTERQSARAEREARYNELLAAELDVTVDELVAARESVRETLKAEMRVELEARLDEKVAAGEITQERADEILARFDAGELRRHRGGPGHRGHGPRPAGPDADQADASAA